MAINNTVSNTGLVKPSFPILGAQGGWKPTPSNTQNQGALNTAFPSPTLSSPSTVTNSSTAAVKGLVPPTLPVTSHTTTTQDNMGNTTTHKQTYDTGGAGGTAQDNSTKIADTQSALTNAEKQLQDAKNGGYGMNDQIQKDANGNVIPKNQTFGGLVSNVLGTAGKSAEDIRAASVQTPQVTQAQTTLSNLQTGMSRGQNQIMQEAIPLQFQTGRLAALQRDYGPQIQAETNLLAQETARQQLAQSGAVSAGGLETGAAGTAATLGQPTTQFGVLTNPQTGLPIGGGSPGNAAFTGGQIQAQQAQGAQVEQYKSALQQAQNLQTQLGDLITTFGLNPNDLNVANAAIQKIAQNTSDPRYQILSNYINDVATRYSQILTPPGGSATDTTRAIATGMLSATAKGQSIIDVMKSLDQQAQAVISGTPTASGSPTNSNTQNSGSFSEGQTTNAGGYDFVFKNGKWTTK